MGNLELQLQSKVDNFDFFSLALDESSDVCDRAQLLIFVPGITKDFKIMEELAAVRSMKGTTTRSDLFMEVNACFDKLGLKWDKLAGVNFIRARALNHRQFVALLEEQDSEHGDIGYHAAVRWLSLGKVLKRVWDLSAEIQDFCEKKGKDIPELSDADWMADLAFAVDVTALMNELNTKLQGKGLFVHEMYSLVKAFMIKLQFLSSKLEGNILTHIPTLKEATPSADHFRRYPSMLNALHGEFSRRFEDFRTVESVMHMVSSPFTCSVDSAPSDVQLKLINLQCDRLLADYFKSVSLLDFYSSLNEENFPHMRRHAQKMLVNFGSTYICEQTFSVMKFNKSRYRSYLTDNHLAAILCISTSDIQPDFSAFAQAQHRLDLSH
ncbi:hypothetical protein LDENG_00205800 [Lucifuga dentata]|nr:hypothetical protein LDENG_00205800 [Lucifuga dentata]